jgi:hypothetical protein
MSCAQTGRDYRARSVVAGGADLNANHVPSTRTSPPSAMNDDRAGNDRGQNLGLALRASVLVRASTKRPPSEELDRHARDARRMRRAIAIAFGRPCRLRP